MSKGSVNERGVSGKEAKPWGQGKFANMPDEVEMKMYPKSSKYGPTVLDDTITHVDSTNSASDSKARKYVSNQH